jgi:DNA-binding beta-propeller fold protein YncE
MPRQSCFLGLSLLIAASAGEGANAQISTPAQVAAQIEQDRQISQLEISDEFLQLRVPGETMGETVGVSQNSQGHIFVYSRTHPTGIARGAAAARLWEFDQNGQFIKEWGPHNYAESFAHNVRVDPHDNVWMVDEGSGMIVKFNPQGVPVEEFGRTPEAIDYLEENVEKAGRGYERAGMAIINRRPVDPIRNIHPNGSIGVFNRPTDVGWDSKGNIYVTDGYGNSRIVKIAPGGHWLKTVGTWGTGDNQFNIVHSIAIDKNDNIYAADRNNHRIQVYDTELNFKRSITGEGAPWGICVTPASADPQYLFSADGTTGRIYKIDPESGKILGWAQTSLGHGEDDAGRLVHEISCASSHTLYLGSAILWDVQRITIK